MSQRSPLYIALGVVLLASVTWLCRGEYAGVDTARTGHTGGIGSFATTTTIPGFKKVEGAMIPRFCQAKELVNVYSTADVSSAIKKAVGDCKGKRLSIRATRQLYHSSSDILCPFTDTDCSIILDMEGLNKVISFDEKSRLLVGGGTLIYARALDFLEERGWTLEFRNLPFYSNLTLAGMLLTGAHGSNTQGPSAFAVLVRSFTWVDAKGEVHSTDNPQRYTGSLGLLGIITELTVAVVPRYKLEGYPQRTHDFDIIERMPGYLQDPDISLVQWLPDVRQAIIMKRKVVSQDLKGEAEFNPLQSNPLISALGSLTLEVNQVDNALLGNTHILDDLPICLAATILLPYFRDRSTKIPFPFGLPVVGQNRYVCCTDCDTGPALGCLWRTTAVTLYELDLDWKVLQSWMRDVRRIIDSEVKVSRQGPCLPSIIEFAMRFGRASNFPLDMAYQQDTVYVDVVSVKGPHFVDAPSNYQHVFDEIEQLTLCKYKARVHWGKNQNRAFTNPNCPTKDKYPLLNDILQEAKQYDPDGIFVPPVFKQLLRQQPLVKTPACAVRAECYCTSDEDCGYKYQCVPGATFPEYLVCKSPVETGKDQVGGVIGSLLQDFKDTWG